MDQICSEITIWLIIFVCSGGDLKKFLEYIGLKSLFRELLGVYFGLNSYLWNKVYLPNIDKFWAK